MQCNVNVELRATELLQRHFTILNKKHLKNVGPIRHSEPRRTPHYYSPGVASVASHAACASMSTTTTTRDRGDRYGPMEWAQWSNLSHSWTWWRLRRLHGRGTVPSSNRSSNGTAGRTNNGTALHARATKVVFPFSTKPPWFFCSYIVYLQRGN